MDAFAKPQVPGARSQKSQMLALLARTGTLPTLPHVATAALTALQEPDIDTDRVCDIIRADVGLAACILRLANSVAYARRRHATTVRESVLTIGLRKTCDIIVAAGGRQIYGVAGEYAPALWNHALAAGIACERLAKLTRSPEADSAFLAGLFHDVGRIGLLLTDATTFGELKAATDHDTRLALERQAYGMDHAEASSQLAESWGLAPSQCVALRWHHDPGRVPVGGHLAALVNAADAVADLIGCGFGALAPEALQLGQLGLSPDEEVACVDAVRETFGKYAELLAV